MIVSFWSCSSSLVLLFFFAHRLHQIVIVVFRWRTNYMRVQIYCCRQEKKGTTKQRRNEGKLWHLTIAPLHFHSMNGWEIYFPHSQINEWVGIGGVLFSSVCVYVPEFLPISKFRIPTRNCSRKKNKSLNGVKFSPLPYHTGFSLGFRSIVCTRSIVRSTGPNLWVSPCPPSFFFAAAPSRPGLLLLLLVGAGAD